MTVFVEQTVTTTWHVDPDELRATYPNEWMEYVTNTHSDAWFDSIQPDVSFETPAEFTEWAIAEYNIVIDDVAWVRYAYESGCEFGDPPTVDEPSTAVWA